MDLMGVCAANNDSAQWCGRNSGMGFKGSWGNVFAGTWDTPHKMVSSEARGWWGGTGSLTGGFAQALFNGAGSNTANNGASFYERRSRSINYHSPSFGGFSVNASTSASNEQTAQSTVALQTLNPRTYSISGNYNNGPLYLGIAYEGHKDFNPTGAVVGTGAATAYNGGTDTNWVFVGRYTFGFGTRLSALYSRSKYDVTNTTELKKNGWAVFADHQLSGPHSIKAQYYKVGDSKGTDTTINVGTHRAAGAETGAYGWAAAYMYQFSKRTEMGFVYGRLKNDLNAVYTRGVSAANPGATQTNYGLNIRHKF
jgi:predicted porin